MVSLIPSALSSYMSSHSTTVEFQQSSTFGTQALPEYQLITFSCSKSYTFRYYTIIHGCVLALLLIFLIVLATQTDILPFSRVSPFMRMTGCLRQHTGRDFCPLTFTPPPTPQIQKNNGKEQKREETLQPITLHISSVPCFSNPESWRSGGSGSKHTSSGTRKASSCYLKGTIPEGGHPATSFLLSVWAESNFWSFLCTEVRCLKKSIWDLSDRTKTSCSVSIQTCSVSHKVTMRK